MRSTAISVAYWLSSMPSFAARPHPAVLRHSPAHCAGRSCETYAKAKPSLCTLPLRGRDKRVREEALQHHVHRLRTLAEAVALLRHVPDARPGEVIGEDRDAVRGQHVERLHPRLRRLLRVRVIGELGERLLH